MIKNNFNLNIIYKVSIQEDKATYLPIAFVFRPELIEKMACFYPYDTGAVHKNIYGDCYSREMQNWDKYKVDKVLRLTPVIRLNFLQ